MSIESDYQSASTALLNAYQVAKEALAAALADNKSKDAEIAELRAEVARLQDIIDGEEPTPNPTPVGGTMWGMGSFAPVNSSSELDPYRNKTDPQVFATLDAEFAALNGGKHMTSVRAFSTGFPATFDQHEANKLIAALPNKVAPVVSVKTTDSSVANGDLDDEIVRFVNSWPDNVRGSFLFNHERDNDADALANPTTVMAVHRKAVARFAAVVISARGTKDITPGMCPTGWNLQDQNTKYPRDVLNPAKELDAVGVGLDEFLYLCDSYQRGTCEPNGVTRVTAPIFKRLNGWGFTRVGLGEIAVDSYPQASRTNAGLYMKDLDAVANQYKVETVNWYSSGGGAKAPAQGWWIYGNPAKKAWAEAVAGG